MFLFNPSWRKDACELLRENDVLHNGAIFLLSVETNLGVHWFWFTLFCGGPENSRHSLDQSHAKLTTWSPAFSRVWGAELVFTLSSPWLFGLFSFHLSGRCKKLWFWFYDHWFLRYSIEKRSNTTQWPWIKLQVGHFLWRPAYYKHLVMSSPNRK